MLDDKKKKKLIELASRSVAVNEKLLNEEKKFIEAVAKSKDVSFLERMSNKIKSLVRKENLYIGAMQSLLNKFKKE